MKNLVRDIKGHRPILISPRVATDYIKSVSDLNIPLTAKVSEMDDILGAIFGKPAVLEKFPPFAIVPIKGVIGSKLSELDKMCGCCDIKSVEEMLEDCERDASISTVILDIDSPGGTSVGVPELAARIRGMSKKVVSFTDSEACSAAYWLGSQASEFYATGSASVGSIGCYIAYEDESARYANEGVVVDVIRAGRVKGAGIAGTSLSAEQRDMLQGEVQEIWEGFKADVKAVREFVDDASMEGQIFSGKKAADAGLVTGLVLGFDEMMETLDAGVAAQMEADEDNDERAESSEGDADAKALNRLASARALGKDVLKALSASRKMKSEGDDEEDEDEESEEGDEKPETEDDDEKKSDPESEDDEEEKKSEDDEEKPESEDDEEKPESEDGEDEPKSEDDEEEKDKPASEDDDEEKEPESAQDGEDEKGEPAQPSAEDDEDKKDDEKSEDDDKDIEEESESGDGPVDTDEKHNRKGSKRNKGRRIA
jgi:signal peptide peptidase SppA